MLKGRRILLGVTGGIAAYKAAEVVSSLRRAGAEVQVVMTRAAQNFVAPLTLAVLSGHRVHTSLFDGDAEARHISLATWGELLLVAPATANIIARAAAGIADDLLSTLLLSFDGPVVFCPAMNTKMYTHSAVQENLSVLERRGCHVIHPETGRLACGAEGPGRLPAADVIVDFLSRLLAQQDDLAGLNVLVTAGPTREPLDPVRYLSNRSSGRMGYAVARAARERGAQVVLVSGPTALPAPAGVRLQRVETADEMYEVVMAHFPDCDVLVMAAAVADFRPAAKTESKIKKDGGKGLVLDLVPTRDILAAASNIKTRQVIVGFAAETERLAEMAVAKARAKGCDLIVANDVTLPGAGFDSDTNQVIFAFPDGRTQPLPLMDKYALAHRILDEIKMLRG
ncbi:MAG: bifunctional phosphopantothenoylcysteine decarboxylase/phosphopantothenate--cysteine ligase CoaBC [Desulfotomaculales bacterium]